MTQIPTDDPYRQHQLAQLGTPAPAKVALGHLRRAPLAPPDVPVALDRDAQVVLGHHRPDPARKAMVTVVRRAPPPRRAEEGSF
jgi:hypothetical protein